MDDQVQFNDNAYAQDANSQPPVDTSNYQQDRSAPNDIATPTRVAAAQPADPVTNALLDIKQQALSQLAPLVHNLDQSPEERFKTTMMMIQASDDQELIKDAYSAAEQITDEKARARALLDIINEINYFTQPSV